MGRDLALSFLKGKVPLEQALPALPGREGGLL